VRLELAWSRVRAVADGPRTRLAGEVLEVDRPGLAATLAADARLGRVAIDLVRRGESCRIGRVFDVVAPRAKETGGVDFPGLLGPPGPAGRGRTRALEGVAVVATDQQLVETATLGLIDTAGPAAELSLYGGMHHVVVSAWPAAGTGRPDYLAALRLAGLRAAVELARAAAAAPPARVEVLERPARVPAALAGLPRVAYVFQIHSHQRPTGAEEGILYGDPVRRMLPTVLHPNEVLDGAVVRGFMSRLATTHAIQDHAVVRELYARHGRQCWFAGVVVTVAQATEPERERSAAMAAALVAETLGADGAVFTKIGGGAPHVDMAQAAARCEALGVRTTLIVEDMSTDGSAEGMLLFNVPGLEALVNVGSAQAPLALPPVARVVAGGPEAEALAGALSVPTGTVCGAIEQIGASRLQALVE
jgi:glycine reductase